MSFFCLTVHSFFFQLYYSIRYDFVDGVLLFFFFFQAEDGIRDDLVTGVQTCALPILALARSHVFATESSRTLRALSACANAAGPSRRATARKSNFFMRSMYHNPAKLDRKSVV